MTNKTMYQQKPSMELKPKQKEIIDLLLKFRYLTKPQLQTLLNHKSREPIRLWLNDLVSKHVLFRIYEKEFGSKPSEYCLDKGSIGYLKKLQYDKSILKRMYYEKTHSQAYRDRCMVIGSVYLSLLALTSKNNTILRFVTNTELKNFRRLIRPQPDAFFHITGKDNQKHPYFIDVFSDNKYIFKRVHQYLKYYKSNNWQRSTKIPFPVVIFICSDDYIKKRIYGFIQNKVTSDAPSFYLLTRKDMEDYGLRGDKMDKVEIKNQ